MDSWARSLAKFRLSEQSSAIREDCLALWQVIADWLFSNKAWHKDGDYLDREFQSCAMHLLFCAHNDFGPVFCAIDEGWPHLSIFKPVLERAVQEFGHHKSLYFVVLVLLKRGGFDFLPDPGLAWLLELVQAKTADQEFWESSGDSTVELLRQVIDRRGPDLGAPHRAAITSISDILVDNGVRGAGFLQQELLRET